MERNSQQCSSDLGSVWMKNNQLCAESGLLDNDYSHLTSASSRHHVGEPECCSFISERKQTQDSEGHGAIVVYSPQNTVILVFLALKRLERVKWQVRLESKYRQDYDQVFLGDSFTIIQELATGENQRLSDNCVIGAIRPSVPTKWPVPQSA